MRTQIITAICLLLLKSIYSQDKSLTGHVFYTDGLLKKPLPSAHIRIIGVNRGSIADSQGKFFISDIESTDTLIISHIGFVTDTIFPFEIAQNQEFILQADVGLQEFEVRDRKIGSALLRAETLSITQLSSAELQKAACCNLSESFENSATIGVSYGDAVSGAKQIEMLGLTGKYVQMMTENIPNLRGLANTFGLGYIPGSWMESIQISKGTSQVMNGYEATTGQINVEFKKPNQRDNFYLNSYINGAGKLELNMNKRFLLGEYLSTMVFFHAEDAQQNVDRNDDGFLDLPRNRQINLYNRWNYQRENISSQLGIKYLYEDRQGGQPDFNPRQDLVIDNPYGIHVLTERFESYAKLGYIFRSRAHTSLGFQNQFTYHGQQSDYGLTTLDARQYSYYGNLIFQSYMFHTNHSFTTGISYQMDQFHQFFQGTSSKIYESVPGIYYQYTYSDGSRLNIIAGMRLDHHNQFGWLYTPRLHTRYSISERHILRISAGRAYRSPQVVIENQSLLASSNTWVNNSTPAMEKAWNLGLHYSWYIDIGSRELIINADAYHTAFDQQIIVDRFSRSDQILIYNLDGRSYANSFQIDATYDWNFGLEATLAYRYNDVRATYNGKLEESPMINRFKALLSLSYQTPLKKWQFDWNNQLNGDSRLPSTFSNPPEYRRADRAPVYLIMNAQISKFFKKWDVYVGVENLGNFTQKNPIIAADDPFGKYFDASQVWGPVMGRMFYAGIRFTIKN